MTLMNFEFSTLFMCSCLLALDNHIFVAIGNILLTDFRWQPFIYRCTDLLEFDG